MVDDYPSTSTTKALVFTNRLLRDINDILIQHEKQITQYDLPALTHENDNENSTPRAIQEELSIEVPREDLCSVERLNNDQSKAFKCIMNTIDRRESGVFFVDGPRGAGKTFLYRAIIAELRNKGHIVLVTASSGIAAILLPGDRIAHSRFKIPINAEPSSICNTSKQSDLAKLIRQTTAIIWDEAPMANKESVQSLDRTLRDILANDMPFGGKVMVMRGDFRQVVPVVPKGSKSQMISASIVKSHLWASTKILHLRQNMRSSNDHVFAKYLMRIGDGIEPTIHEDFVRIQANMTIPWEGETSLHKLIEEIFPNLQSHGWDASYMVERAILTPKNHDVQQLNDIIINQFPREEQNLVSFDEVEGDANNLYQQEYLNSVSTYGLPPHVLKVKKGAPLMLLRNIDPKAGLCNGTRLLRCGNFKNMLNVEILTGHHCGRRAFFPRIKHKTTENSGLPFILIRKQFSVMLSFAITINKLQGQTIPKVGIYIPKHVFSHGQLYVALSRSISQSTKILVKEGKIDGTSGEFTRNVIFKDILLPSPQLEPSLFVELAAVAVQAAAAAVTHDTTEVSLTAVDADLSRGEEEERRERKGKLCSMVEDWISQTNARQRRDRAGCVKPGTCFCLYTRHRFKRLMRPYQVSLKPLEGNGAYRKNGVYFEAPRWAPIVLVWIPGGRAQSLGIDAELLFSVPTFELCGNPSFTPRRCPIT
ncbi:ATP-dependent DNA helicase PIF1-like [Arachis ipaensis]|uniref:ATP-dependent DNA helicase PIF1-like n=1 Tax=Arachis ipaensis TaxID=130454 RepID=UPI000A2B207B|nr:ATP-dependent DNA helicase PIF1-like [Arachis ipaensis]